MYWLTRFILLCLALVFCDPAIAKFSKKSRSIHGTAENLPENDWEVSPVHLSYGIHKSLMLTATDPLMITRRPTVELQYQFRTPKLLLSPHIAIGQALSTKEFFGTAGLGLGLFSGKRRQHSYSFKIAKQFQQTSESNIFIDAKKQSLVRATIQYDYYTRSGNLFYIGARGLKPYVGFTWAYDHVHYGFALFPLYGWQLSEDGINVFSDRNFIAVIPLPYIYWRL